MTLSEGIVKINSKLLEASELKRYDKLEKEAVGANAAVLKDIRLQLNDQLKCLDSRLEIQQGIVNEFQDVFRRKAEIELSYSKELDKLAKSITHRNKEHKQKRDGWQLFSSMQVWEQLVAQTKKASRDHSALAEIYTTHITQRCNNINEDLQRMYRKCREIGYEIHEEVLKILHELHTAMKTHHTYQSEFRQAETKLQLVEKQRTKLQNSVPVEKREKHKKFRLIEKEFQKRKQKYDDARVKATKARNEYLLCMDAANASIQKYFVDDLSDLIDCMDFGFHQSLFRAVMMHSSGLDQIRRSLQQDIDALGKSLTGLDSRLDKQRFFEDNTAAFMLPKKFEYNPVRRDESETLVQKSIMDELESRKKKLHELLATLKVDSEEIWKSMETAEKSLSEMVGCGDWDTTRFFVEEDRNAHREPEAIVQKQKADRQEIEEFYTAKFREYVLNSNRVARLQAKYDHVRMTLGDQTCQPAEGILTLTRRPNAGRRRRIGKTPRQGGLPKLFGGSLEEYLEETNQEIPVILKSCIRVINLYGLHHHGIFRVSGSQVEIGNFRDAFERGEDPLADTTDASDINSVAGVLKLYLRELREPLFPIQYFDHFMELAQLESKHEFVVKVRDLVTTWPRPIFIVMRYLFAFLNHLSEFSDENMMDPYNLAICFGPTLVPIPENRDQVQFQNLVNELIKNFIIFHEDIFPTNVPGCSYEKYMTLEPDDMGDSPAIDQSQDDLDIDSELTEDDSVFKEDNEKDDMRDFSLDLFGKSEALEAQAIYDFCARSAREVNFSKGDTILLFKQVSNDWWKGSVRGHEGLIPDKYIMLKIRGEDERERLESFRSLEDGTVVRERSGSSEEPSGNRSRASSSSDTHRFSQPSPSPVQRRRTSSTQHGSASSPMASPVSQRASRNSTNSTRSSSAAATKPPSPAAAIAAAITASSTVISVPSGSRRKSKDSQKSADTSSSASEGIERRVSLPKDVTPPPLVLADEDNTSSAVVGNTHIIRVSGPVTNLDETVTSGAQPSRMSEAMCPRSRLPLSPSMEARLSSSQDSLISTGSNQELKSQLDTTLAEVEAIAEQLEKQKISPSHSSDRSPVQEQHQFRRKLSPGDPPKPTVRRKTSEELPAKPAAPNGARPRERASIATISPPAPVPRSMTASTSDLERKSPPSSTKESPGIAVMLRQSTWTSREQMADYDNGNGNNNANGNRSFTRNKNLWERRVSSTTTASAVANAAATAAVAAITDPPPEEDVRGGFRSNRDFWNQRVTIQRQKQTPDLVLDLPPSSLNTSGTSTTGGAPVPKPRPRGRPVAVVGKGAADSLSSSSGSSGDENLAAEQFAKPDRNTIRKTSSSPGQRSPDTENTPAATATTKQQPPVQARLKKSRGNPPRHS